MRSFLAFEVPAELRRAIGARLAPWRERLPRARWSEPAAMHLTLVFLGEIEESSLARLGDELAGVFASEAPCRMTVGEVGEFPAGRPARVVWLGIAPSRDLAPLRSRAAAACQRAAGVAPDEKPFHPHLTLARCDPPWPRAAVGELRQAAAGPWGEPFTAREAVLFRSHLGRGGARHEALLRLPLAGVA